MDNYYLSNKFRQILHVYEDMHDRNVPGYLDAEELTDVAQYYHEQGEDDKATEAIDLALSIFPGSVMPLAFKARVELLSNGNTEKADHIADEIDDKSDLDYLLLKAEIMVADNRPQDADAFLEENFANLYGDESEDFAIDVALLFSDYAENEYCAKWLERSSDKDSEDYKEVKARLLSSQGKFKESEKLFNELLDANPFSTSYWNQLASTQLMHDDASSAITSSEYSIAIDPDDPDATINRANGLLSLGNYIEAAKGYEKYTKLDPDNEAGYLFWGIALMGQNRLSEALAKLTIALEKSVANNASPIQNRIQIVQQLSLVENQLGNYEKSLKHLDDIETLLRDNYAEDSEALNKQLASLDITRAYVYMEQSQEAQAEYWYHKAMKEAAEQPETIVNIAISVFENGFFKFAYTLLHKALYVDRMEVDEGYSYLAVCCLLYKHMDEFQWALAMAVSHNTDEASVVLKGLFPDGTKPQEWPDMKPSDTNINPNNGEIEINN